MEEIKSFFSRFKDDRGDFGITIGIIAVIAIAVGLNAIGESSEEMRDKVQKPYITMDKMPDPDKVDTGKVYIEGKKNLMEGYKKIAEDTVGLVSDETGVLGVLKETGVFDVPKEDKKEGQEDESTDNDDAIFVDGLIGAVEGGLEGAGGAEDLSIEEKLDENNLPTDVITQDITKIVANIANQLGSSDSEIADIVDASIETMKDLTNKDKDEDIDNDSSETLEKVKEKLSEKNKLENEVIINKRKEYNLSVLEKKQLEKEIEVYEHYKNTDTIIISDEIYIKIQSRLDHLNKKIDDLEKEFQENEDNSEGQDIEDVIAGEETRDAPTNEKVIEEVTAEVITLNGTMSTGGDTAATMSMTIDLGTGAVSGIIYIRVYFEDFDYQFEEDVPISGSMDLETRNINAKAGHLRLTGRLSADGNNASGTASSDDESASWSVSR